MKIAGKIVCLAVGGILVFAVIVCIALNLSLNRSGRDQLAESRRIYLKEKEVYLRDLVDSAWQTAEKIAAMYPDDPAKAKKLTVEILSHQRYQDKSGYFFCYQKNPDGQVIFAFHGARKDFVGNDAKLDEPDIKGNVYRRKMIENAEAGKDEMTEYYFEKPTTKEIVKKFAYTRKFAPWNWYISGGIYVDDIEKNLERQSLFMQGQTRMVYAQIIGISLLVLAVAAIIAVIVAKGIARPLVKAVSVAEAIASGDLSRKMEIVGKDETATLARAVDRVPDVLNEINRQFEALARAAEAGDLAFRAEPGQLHGAYRRIIDAVNLTLDNVVRPINMSMKTLNSLSRNDLMEKVDTSELRGDYLHLAESVNALRDCLLQLQDTASAIAVGDLAPLDEYIRIGKRSDNDRLMPAYIRMMKAIKALIDDAGSVAQAASAGQLSARLGSSKHEGAYREVADGFNRTLDAINTPLKEVAAVMDGVAGEHDLTLRIKGNYLGDLEKLKSNINRAISSMDMAIGRVSEVADQVNSGSVQIANASQTMAQGATEQAASMEEISSSISHIGAQSGRNAVNADNVNNLVNKTKTATETGSENMDRMKLAMAEINEATGQIAQINKLIDDIAFQTNLLALNAAVEAARAGSHGKGFAVVAEEVRNLAGRSSRAAAEAVEKIETASAKVENGIDAVNRTSESFSAIISDIGQISSLTGDIALASNEQKKSIDGINQGLAQIDQVTQQNAAVAEESAAASEELSGQASNMINMIHEFRVTEFRSNSLPA